MGAPKEIAWSSVRTCACTPPPRCRPRRSSAPARASGTRRRCASAPASAPAASSARTCTSTSTSSSATDVKVQNNVSLFHGVTVEDGVFVGPHVCFTNDRVPRAINRDGSLEDRCRLGGLPDPRPPRRGARRQQHDPAGRDDRALGDDRLRQRGHPRRGRSRAGGRQPGASAGQRLPVRPAAARRRRRGRSSDRARAAAPPFPPEAPT